MKYRSSRDPKGRPVDFVEALRLGLAEDGGLYVPEAFPKLNISDFLAEDSPATFAKKLLQPFVKDSPLESFIESICQIAFNFSLPLKQMTPQISILELFHGPTLAFKDVGARFLAECMNRAEKNFTVLVATSGDTGGAVAAAFSPQPGARTVILYPKGMISARQEQQLTCWGERVLAFRVRGDFDSCQRLVKDALSNKILKHEFQFVSANSISLGRLLPQMVYHARASVQYHSKTARRPTLIVPTGNLGNAVAALWAKHLGFPIGKVVLATNANTAIADYFKSGQWAPRPTIPTLANAMDVGSPSNFERLISLYPDLDTLRRDVEVHVVTDSEIRETIQNCAKDYGEIFCPHTATAMHAALNATSAEGIIVEATAHPAKFETIVEPLIGRKVPIPASLNSILSKTSRSIEIEPDLQTILDRLRAK